MDVLNLETRNLQCPSLRGRFAALPNEAISLTEHGLLRQRTARNDGTDGMGSDAVLGRRLDAVRSVLG